MKSSYCPPDVSAELHDWLDKSSCGYSLVIAATCGCDISKLGKTVCDHLNLTDYSMGRHFMVFDPDDIRHIAGVPDCREAVMTAAADMGVMVEYGCDYDSVLQAIAAMGDAVLCGEWAFETLLDMDHVFRVVLSHCNQCGSDHSLTIDPQSYSDGGLAKIIAKRFKHWVEDQSSGRKKRTLRSMTLPMLL
jgi:hypothetical protein